MNVGSHQLGLVFLGIEAAALTCAVAALRNVNPNLPGAVWIALRNPFAPRETFTERGWKYRSIAWMLQIAAVAWILASPALV